MKLTLWILVSILAVIIIALLLKLYLMKKAAKEIADAFADRLITDTNTLIDISCRDHAMQYLTNTINAELRKFRAKRHQFEQGDIELRNAVTNISHDLRTPLTAICGYLDLLEQEKQPETTKRYLAVIRNRTDMLTQLTEELFRYSVILSEETDISYEPIAINDVLEESIAAFYTALTERGITPDIQIPSNKVVRMLDRSALSRVFANLLNNAMKYSDGDLDITLSEMGQITFTNTAAGLNTVQAGRLFDRFYTVDTARKSTGLGLAIARTLVEQMGGCISAAYENGRLSICISFLQSTASRPV